MSSLLVPSTAGVISSAAGFNDRDSVHIWHAVEHAVCGVTESSHTCGEDDGDFVYAEPGETCCRACRKQLCVYCRLLLGWPV